jgi:hypothetical protein
MADKQIIIDGVPVQDCKFYTLQEHYDMESDGLGKVCYSKDWKYSICANNPNYYYKQLKLKQQECERLKEILKDEKDKYNKLAVNYDAYVSMANKQLNQLKGENKKLNHELYMAVDEGRAWIEKYKQTLTEIKELMKIEIECKTYEIENDCFNETRCKALKEHIDFTKQILRKISEGLNDD